MGEYVPLDEGSIAKQRRLKQWFDDANSDQQQMSNRAIGRLLGLDPHVIGAEKDRRGILQRTRGGKLQPGEQANRLELARDAVRHFYREYALGIPATDVCFAQTAQEFKTRGLTQHDYRALEKLGELARTGASRGGSRIYYGPVGDWL